MSSSMSPHKGFTLLEVLIALAIIAIALTALVMVTGQNIKQTQQLKDTMAQNWVARQALNQIKLGLIIPPMQGLSTYKTKWLNQDWYWRVLIEKTQSKRVKSLSILTSKNQSGPFSPSVTGYWLVLK